MNGGPPSTPPLRFTCEMLRIKAWKPGTRHRTPLVVTPAMLRFHREDFRSLLRQIWYAEHYLVPFFREIERSPQLLRELRRKVEAGVPAAELAALDAAAKDLPPIYLRPDLDERLHPRATDVLILANGDRSENERLGAAQRIAAALGHVIHPKRWPIVMRELVRLADQHKRSAVKELEAQVEARLFEAIHHDKVLGLPVTEINEIMKAIRSRLNKLLTEDLAGPGWRRRQSGKDIDYTEEPTGRHRRTRVQSIPAALEARLGVDRLLKSSRLAPREVDLLSMMLLSDSIADAAIRLGIKPATARVLLLRVRKKIRPQ